MGVFMKITLIDPGFMRTFDNVKNWEIRPNTDLIKFITIEDIEIYTNLKYIIES
jgi:hypothetical protein